MGNEKPLWIIGSLLALLLLPATFVAGLVLGNNIASETTLANDSLSAWVAALATLAIAVLTFILALETWKLRRAQDQQLMDIRKHSIQPQMELYLESSRQSFQFMNLHVENVGRGMAKDITFKISNSGQEPDVEKEIENSLKKLNLIKNGMTSLGVERSRKSFIFSFIDLFKKHQSVFDACLNITITYKDVEGNVYTTESIIDLSEYKGITELGNGHPLYNLSKNVEATRNLVESMTKGQKALNVNIHTKSDRDERSALLKKQHEEYLAQKG